MLIEQREIAKELKKLKSIAPNSKINESNGILFKSNMLTASNPEITVTAQLSADTDEEFVIPLKAIDYIESLPSGEIEITTKSNRLHIKGQRGTSSFITVGVDDFIQYTPSDTVEQKETLGYDGEAFAEAINKVLYACNANSSRPVMNGILLRGDGKYLNIVACDGFRLAWNQISCNCKINVVVPKNTIQKVLSLGLQGGIKLYAINNKKAVFKTDKYSVYTQLLTGDYINYEPMFDEEGYNTKVSVKRIELLESVARSVICSGDQGLPKTVLESTEDGNLAVTVNSTIADFREVVDVFSDFDSKIKIGFNARYLIEAFKASDEDNIDIYYKSEQKALWLFDGSIKQLVLPIRM